MKIIKNILVILVIFILFSCNDDSTSKNNDSQELEEEIQEFEQEVSPFPDYVNLTVINPETAGFHYPNWDGVLDERGFDPLGFYYPEGSVKRMKVWATKIQGDNTEKEHILTKIYNDHRRLLQKMTYHYGDESGWNYVYDDYGRLIIVEETFNGVIVPERQLTYKYLLFDPDNNEVVREVNKNNKLIQIETEQVIDNKISLEIDFSDKKTTETDSLYFEDGNNVKYINDSGPRFRYVTQLSYENNILMKMINFNSKEEKMFIHDFKYNEDSLIIEGITHDYRDNPPTIMRTQKAMDHDQHRNWLRKELYENDILVGVIEREISYY